VRFLVGGNTVSFPTCTARAATHVAVLRMTE
jgi:hypothetical protein